MRKGAKWGKCIKMCINLIPKHKSDYSTLDKLKEIDTNEAKPILGALLEWLEDMNWPVAMKVFKILPRFHAELIPCIKEVFEIGNCVWTANIMSLLLEFPADSVKPLYPEIIRIAKHPTEFELLCETYEFAIDVINKFNIKT